RGRARRSGSRRYVKGARRCCGLVREGLARSRPKEWVSPVRERRAAPAARWCGKGETRRDESHVAGRDVALVIGVGCDARGLGLALDRVFQTLAGAERGSRRRTDLDLLARAGVAAGAGLPLLGLERAEPGDLHPVALAERRRDDAAADAEERLDRARCIGLAHLGLVGQRLDQIRLV